MIFLYIKDLCVGYTTLSLLKEKARTLSTARCLREAVPTVEADKTRIQEQMNDCIKYVYILYTNCGK